MQDEKKSTARTKLIEDINNVQREISTSISMAGYVKTLHYNLIVFCQNCATAITRKKFNGFIVWASAEYDEGVKKSRYFANLIRKEPEPKTLKK